MDASTVTAVFLRRLRFLLSHSTDSELLLRIYLLRRPPTAPPPTPLQPPFFSLSPTLSLTVARVPKFSFPPHPLRPPPPPPQHPDPPSPQLLLDQPRRDFSGSGRRCYRRCPGRAAGRRRNRRRRRSRSRHSRHSSFSFINVGCRYYSRLRRWGLTALINVGGGRHHRCRCHGWAAAQGLAGRRAAFLCHRSLG